LDRVGDGGVRLGGDVLGGMKVSVLFVIGRQDGVETAVEIARRVAEEGEGVTFLFIRDGIRHAQDRDLISGIGFCDGIYVLKPDDEGSGIEELPEGVSLISYDGWVELIEGSERLVSWV